MKKRDDGPPKTPGYLVSFGDMMTILLTFFILLCTYAVQRESGFVSDGIGSFNSAIETLGLPGLLSSERTTTQLGADRIRAKTRERKDKGERDQDERRISDEIEVLRKARVEELPLDGQVRLGLPIRFAPGSAEPLPGGEGYFRTIAGLAAAQGRRVEILGHADREELPRAERLGLALARATRIVEILQRKYGAPATGLAAGAGVRSRVDATGAIPEGQITLRVYRPGRFRELKED